MAIKNEAELKAKLKATEDELLKNEKEKEKKLRDDMLKDERRDKGHGAEVENEQEKKREHEQKTNRDWEDFMHAAKELQRGMIRQDTFESAMHEIIGACVLMNRVMNTAIYPDLEYRPTIRNAVNLGAKVTGAVVGTTAKVGATAATLAITAAALPLKPLDLVGIEAHKAVHQGLKKGFDAAGTGVSQASEALKALVGQAPQAVRDYYEQKMQPVANVALPSIKPVFTVANDGKITLTPMEDITWIDSSNQTQTVDMKHINSCIALWLEEHGCEADPVDNVFRHKGTAAVAGAVLSKSELEKMHDDPVSGMGAFFKKYSNLDVHAEISPPSAKM